MVNAVKKAQDKARKIIESTYDGIATVTEHIKVKDEKSKLTKYEESVVLENQPCKLSYETITNANQGESASSVKQVTKLFISPDIIIKAGSKITVTQAGVTIDYTCSGIPAVYDTHQEIILNLFERWA